MRLKHIALPLLALALSTTLFGEAFAERKVHRPHMSKSGTSANNKADKGKEKPFAEMTKDKVAVEGLFTFYRDTVTETYLMEVHPDQIGPIYLCGESLVKSEGRFYDNGNMRRTFPFYFKRVGKTIMLMEKNLRLRADSGSAALGAIESAMSDHLFGSAQIKSKPEDSSQAVLIDPADFFIRDASNVGYFLGTRGRTGHSFDSKNSYFDRVKSFPQNTEIDVKLHYKTKKPQSGTTLQSGYSMFHTYHYSLSSLPESDYVPRIADDRIGYFLTMYQDYSHLDMESPYVRYIKRWHLKKKNPEARISEPVEPIVYWIENTVPKEYRDAIAEAIEFWNPAFEKLGFRNAVVAKQMPDTADWDPADSRYNVVQWMITPGQAYAVGPSRANPFTGQIYDADIRISADWIRYMYNTVEYFISPVSFDGQTPFDELDPLSDRPDVSEKPWEATCCQAEMAREAGMGLVQLLVSSGDLVDKDSLTREYVHAYLVEVIAHEVGHTLGLRHNFKGSSIYTLDQINDREFTRTHGTIGSIMDYSGVNIAGPDKPQGEFYTSIPGPYDMWAIEYGYSIIDATTPDEELLKLQEIASRSAEPELVYLTDEDTFGWSTRGMDPLSNMHDLGADPLRFALHKVDLTRHLWHKSMAEFEKPGVPYPKLRRVFGTGWRAYYELARIASRYVGGIYHHRNHIGDPGGKVPFIPVAAIDQRRAMNLMKDHLFAADAFDLPAGLLNKLQPERNYDFTGSAFRLSQMDYPYHQIVLRVQRTAIDRLYAPLVLGRLVNNRQLYEAGEDVYAIDEMFHDVRQTIWGEMLRPANTNSFRRQLQMAHLNTIIAIYLARSGVFPYDAYALAAGELQNLADAAKRAIASSKVDNMSRVHFSEVLRQIEAAQGAQRDFSGTGR